MRKVHLHGVLAKYGETFELDVLTAGEAIAALAANFPEFVGDLREGSWVVLRGDPETGICLDEEMVAGMRLGDADLHIMPEVVGAKNGNGVLKAIIGIALIAVSAGSAAPFLATQISGKLFGAATWGNVIGQLGLAMALSGVSSMLAPETETGGGDDEKSYTMTGPTSGYGQGQAVQIAYGGPIITGGMMISGGIDADGLESVVEEPVVTPDPATVTADPENEGGPSF